MNAKEKTDYLANVVLLSMADGSLGPEEAGLIETIRDDIGATPQEMQNALEMVASGKHVLTPVKRFSDRARNLEDMLLVSLADGEFVTFEKEEILAYAKMIPVTRDQLAGMLKEMKQLHHVACGPLTCCICNREIPDDSRFCPLCGEKIQSDARHV